MAIAAGTCRPDGIGREIDRTIIVNTRLCVPFATCVTTRGQWDVNRGESAHGATLRYDLVCATVAADRLRARILHPPHTHHTTSLSETGPRRCTHTPPARTVTRVTYVAVMYYLFVAAKPVRRTQQKRTSDGFVRIFRNEIQSELANVRETEDGARKASGPPPRRFCYGRLRTCEKESTISTRLRIGRTHAIDPRVSHD